ncbi:hypothetical protein L249_1160 [Ophiocordyceps polyrhachis-furcata BCC 54312]|uniref:GrpB domain protein n=1 Tax=Ophiocordyceps polyrhachis-furcata BCC 54312 TaxID=1330021 RepID=A0A367LDI3_9HYPO|nr:hypothetical protein L249_1160 [Ophiocordyceps polyrhachis-furcata BCC 54312]
MPIPIEAIVKNYDCDPALAQRLATRPSPPSLTIVSPNRRWPSDYADLHAVLVSALGPTAISIGHTGSTSVPGLPAKDCIDVDVCVADVDDEGAYVPALEEAGFLFLLRERSWHGHRLFCRADPGLQPVNLHVWPRDCPEVERHRIFRDWLVREPEDRALYARVKREASAAALEAGEGVEAYNLRKEATIRHILDRAFRHLGYVD